MRLGVLLFAGMLVSAQPYDLLIRHGHVIDAKNHISAVRDVAIRDHRIAAVEANIPPETAHKVVDATGLYVTPGLVDLHTHVYAGTGDRGSYAGDESVYPDGFTFRSGVTTVVDAGSSGWRDFPDFRDRVIDRARTRVLAFLNIVGSGMNPRTEQNMYDMDAKSAADQVLANRDVIVGIKTAHYNGPEWIGVERAVEAGTMASVPVMVDFGAFRPERPFQQLVTEKLRPGDIYTHMYLNDVPMLDDSGKLQPYLADARRRGVIFDVGHGAGSFLWRQAVPAVKQGFTPDSISTDLHTGSMNAGMKDLLNVMSKFLAMGMSLDDVVARATWNPAHEIHHEELGQLGVGAPADVTVLRLDRGKFGFVDVYGARLTGDRMLTCELTVRDGLVVWDRNGMTREDWDKLDRKYGAQGDPTWDGTIMGIVRGRK